MSDLQDTIVHHLTHSFIHNRIVDPRGLAQKLKRDYPAVELDELVSAICRVANGVGVRIRENVPGAAGATKPSPCTSEI